MSIFASCSDCYICGVAASAALQRNLTANGRSGSTIAAPAAGGGGSYSPDNGREGRSPSRLLRAISDHKPELLRAMFDVGYFPPNTPLPDEWLRDWPSFSPFYVCAGLV